MKCIIQLDHPTDLLLLALKWLGYFQKSNPLSKDEDLPLLKMCLRLWRQFPKRSPNMCMSSSGSLPYSLPAGSNLPRSQKHLQDPACMKLPLTSSAPQSSLKRLDFMSPFFHLTLHSSVDDNLLWLPSLHWNNLWDIQRTKERPWWPNTMTAVPALYWPSSLQQSTGQLTLAWTLSLTFPFPFL